MKKRSIVLGLAVLVFGMSSRGSIVTMGTLNDFFAPVVNDKTSLPNTIPAGSIIFENQASSAGFWGLAPNGTWVSMGGLPVTHTSWSGYHDSNCSWNFNSASMNDPTAVSVCGFGPRTNTGFVTVASLDNGTPGNNYPGITFSPNKTGNYYVCAKTAADVGGAGVTSGWQLVDATPVTIVTQSVGNPSGGSSGVYPMSLCAIYNVPAVPANVVIKIQGEVGSSTSTIGGFAPGTKAIEWSIFQID